MSAVLCLSRNSQPDRALLQGIRFFVLLSVLSISASAQDSSSISNSPPQTQNAPSSSSRSATQPEAAGSAITLETSEPLFTIATALNVCGYDSDLANSNPVRSRVREEVAESISHVPAAADKRALLCKEIQSHQLSDQGRSIAQYVSLALYLGPDLEPTVAETELPPDSNQVITVLPLLRDFRDAVHLHAIWVAHHADYEGLVNHLHEPLTRMILSTNIYLHSPVSSYDGRRFLVLLEPMLAPSTVNARIYGNNYVVVVSPTADAVAVHMEQIRHTYLHYEIEPMVYARAAAMNRLLPLLRPVQEAPIEFTYKSDIVALLAECLIKAIEARTMDVGLTRPIRPKSRQRQDQEKFDVDRGLYDRQAEAIRRRSVDLSMRQGWVLTDYFYGQLISMERDGVSLKDNIGPMVYGMDVDRQKKAAQQISFLPETPHDVLRRVPVPKTGLDVAEAKITQGDAAGAKEMAQKALEDPAGDHARAHYLLARIDLLERQPGEAVTHFHAALDTSKDPRTVAWSHIYLGRLYDVQSNRKMAVAEYQAALAARDVHPDTKVAADEGLKRAFALPTKEAVAPPDSDDDAPVDPSGKAEKDAYKPPPPQ